MLLCRPRRDHSSGRLRAAVRQPQPARVLGLLLAQPGEVIAREELYRRLWGDESLVDIDHRLNACVKQIRDALGDDADVPRFVETLPKRGYRFIAEVKSAAPAPPPPSPLRGSPARRRAVAAVLLAGLLAGAAYGLYRLRPDWLPFGARPKKVRLLVLPFENLSQDPEEEYFSDGLTDEITTQLSRLDSSRLGVIARTTARRFKDTPKSAGEIGRDLGVDYILEGAVRRADSRVRITAQLIETRHQTHLWADTFERPVADILQIQREVARRTADSLALKLLPPASRPAAPDPRAYDAYLRGRYQWNKRTPDALARSIEHFEQAIARDPDFALAYVGLADAYAYALLGTAPYDGLPSRDALPRARAAAQKALALDPTLAEAYASLAHVRLSYDWDWEGAERDFQRALELNPGYPTAHQWYALFLVARGRRADALAEIHRALELDPLSLVGNETRARILYYLRDYDRVIEQCRKTLDLDPSPIAHFYLGEAYLAHDRTAEALAELRQAKTLARGSPAMVMALGFAAARAGQPAEARQALAELHALAPRRYVPAIYIAALHTALGDKDRAFAWLEKAYADRYDYLVYLNVEPLADSLRSDPRFQNLLRRLNLPM